MSTAATRAVTALGTEVRARQKSDPPVENVPFTCLYQFDTADAMNPLGLLVTAELGHTGKRYIRCASYWRLKMRW